MKMNRLCALILSLCIMLACIPVQAQDKAPYDRVIILGIDSGGAFIETADTPNLDALFANGAVTYQMFTTYPTLSSCGWGSMFTGVGAMVHGRTNTDVNGGDDYDPNSEHPTIFRLLHEQQPNSESALFCGWKRVIGGLVESHPNSFTYGGPDENLPGEFANYLQDHDPKLVYFHFDTPDYVGHRQGGFGEETHLAQINIVDGYIGQIVEAVEKSGKGGRTLWISLCDHGGVGESHGSFSQDERLVYLALSGETVVPGSIGYCAIRDVAAIVCYALGITPPDNWTAHVPDGIFNDPALPPYPDLRMYANRRAAPEIDPSLPLVSRLTFDEDGTVEGIFGKGLSIGMGDSWDWEFEPCGEAYTVGMWMSLEHFTQHPPILCNKDWVSGANPGLTLALDDGLRLNAGDGETQINLFADYPDAMIEDWMHILFTVTPQQMELYVNFVHKGSISLEELEPQQWLTDSLVIGDDTTYGYPAELVAVADEALLFNEALTSEQVELLRSGYLLP